MSNKGKLILFHGDKGGIGKSFMASIYIDYLLSSVKKDQVIVVESDTRNPDVARLFLQHVRVENIDLKLHDGWMELADLLADNPDHEVVVSLPAGIGHFVEEEAAYLTSVLKDLCHTMKVYWPINRLKDSIILLKEFLNSPLSDLSQEIVVIQNGFFGDQRKFVRWSDSKTRKKFLARPGAREAFLPELHERVVDSITGPFSMAEGLKYSEKTELERWIRAAHAAVLGG